MNSLRKPLHNHGSTRGLEERAELTQLHHMALEPGSATKALRLKPPSLRVQQPPCFGKGIHLPGILGTPFASFSLPESQQDQPLQPDVPALREDARQDECLNRSSLSATQPCNRKTGTTSSPCPLPSLTPTDPSHGISSHLELPISHSPTPCSPRKHLDFDVSA